MIPETSPTHARRTAPAVTVSSIAQELHDLYSADYTLQQLTSLTQQMLRGRGYTNVEPESAVWSSNREQILEAFRRHAAESDA
jgi:hypothetical protein